MSNVAHGLARNRNHTDRSGLAVDHADGGFVGDHAGDRRSGGVARDGDHVQAHRADRGHGFELFERQSARARSGFNGAVFGHRNEGAGKPAHVRRGKNTALLHLIVEHRENGRRAGSTDGRKAERLEDLAHAVAHCRRRGKREIRHAERKVQAVGDFIADDFTHAGHLVGGVLDDFCRIRDRQEFTLGLKGTVKSLFHHARAGNTDVDHHIGFADAKIGTCHKWHVLRNIAEDNELGAADCVAVASCFRHIQNALTHEAYGIHVDAGLRRTHID